MLCVWGYSRGFLLEMRAGHTVHTEVSPVRGRYAAVHGNTARLLQIIPGSVGLRGGCPRLVFGQQDAAEPDQDWCRPVWYSRPARQDIHRARSWRRRHNSPVRWHSQTARRHAGLTLNRHMTQVVRACNYHTRALRHIRPLLTCLLYTSPSPRD